MQPRSQVIAPAKQHGYPPMATLVNARHFVMRQIKAVLHTNPDISSSRLLVMECDEVLLLL